MFIPLYDSNPLRAIATPVVNYAMIFACSAIYLVFQSGLVIDADLASIASFSVIPADFYGPRGVPAQYAVVPEPLTLITYAFLHGGWMHLIGNMLFLWVFGDNVEDAMGHARYLAFYLACAAAAGLAHAAVTPASSVPLVGASGAVAGVVAAYVMLHPRVKVWVLFLGRIPLKISAMWAIGAWIVFQFVMAAAASDQSTAWWAHIGGLAAGAVLTPLLRRPGVPLFDRNLPA